MAAARRAAGAQRIRGALRTGERFPAPLGILSRRPSADLAVHESFPTGFLAEDGVLLLAIIFTLRCIRIIAVVSRAGARTWLQPTGHGDMQGFDSSSAAFSVTSCGTFAPAMAASSVHLRHDRRGPRSFLCSLQQSTFRGDVGLLEHSHGFLGPCCPAVGQCLLLQCSKARLFGLVA